MMIVEVNESCPRDASKMKYALNLLHATGALVTSEMTATQSFVPKTFIRVHT